MPAPIATPFTALGEGTGFPSCINTVWVGWSDYWTTLSGFNKNSTGSPTQASIDESFRMAMNLYWNLHEFTLTCSHTPVFDQPAASIDKLVVGDQNEVDFEGVQPVKRACWDFSSQFSRYIYSWRSAVEAQSNWTRANSRVGIFAYYDTRGLLGYAANSSSVSLNVNASLLAVRSSISPLAGVNLTGNVRTAVIDPTPYLQNYAYVELDGMHFVCQAYASDGYDDSATIDAANLTAECTRATYNPAGSVTVEASITGFNFYAYS